MEALSVRLLTLHQLEPFLQYLLPQAVDQTRDSSAPLTVLGAVCGRFACGAAAIRWREGYGEIVSLFVDPAARRRGVAGLLLDLAVKEALAREFPALECSYVLNGDALSAMDALLCHRGAQPRLRSAVYRVDTAQVHDLPVLGYAFRPTFRPAREICLLCDLEQEALEALAVEHTDIPNELSLAVNADRSRPELSLCWVKEGRALAYVLGDECADGGLVLSTAVSLPDAPGRAFLALLQALLNRVFYRSGGDFLFYASALNPHTDALIQALTRGRYIGYEEHYALLPLSHTPNINCLHQEERG